jgi:hypothetical protein
VKILGKQLKITQAPKVQFTYKLENGHKRKKHLKYSAD